MTHVLTIAAREVRERTFVLWTAAAIAVFPFLAQLLPGTQRWPKGEIIQASAAMLAVVVTLGLALLLGGTFVARDLVDRRLSFYFSKPVSASSIWFGKLLGAVVLAGLVFAIICVPALLVAPRSVLDQPAQMLAAFVLGLSVILILMAHAAGTMFRARSTALIVDLIALVVWCGAGWALIQSFVAESAHGVVNAVAVILASSVLIGLVGAGAWQLSRGRTDVKRSHREMSKFLWSAVAAGVVLAGLYAAWVRSADVSDLMQPRAEQNATRDFALVGGPARWRAGYMPVFLMNLRTGESKRFASAENTDMMFTPDGRAVFGITQTSTPTSQTGHLIVQRLGRDDRPVIMPVTFNGGGRAVLSGDLTRAAVLHGPSIAVYRIEDGRLLASVRLQDPGHSLRAFFPSRDVLRLLVERGEPRSIAERVYKLQVLELDIPHRRLSVTGGWQTAARGLTVSANADGSALVARRFDATGGPAVYVLDGRTAAPRFSLDKAGFVRAISDGRLASLARDGGARKLSVFSPTGTLQREIVVNNDEWGYVAGEAGVGRVVVATRRSGAWGGGETGRGWQITVVDIDGGIVLRREANLFISRSWSSTDPRSENPNTTGDYLLTDAQGAVWRWNALSGVKKKL